MADSTGNISGRNSSGASQPITRHPLFPAIVALWCGAAFGLGSLVLPVSIVEHAVSATHLDTVIPKAAPPLGATARILVALGLTCLGGVIGLVIARRIVPPAAAPHSRRRGQPTAAANEMLPESFFDEPAIEGRFAESAAQQDERPAFAPPLDMPVQRRRRALALSDVEPIHDPALEASLEPESVEQAPVEQTATRFVAPEPALMPETAVMPELGVFAAVAETGAAIDEPASDAHFVSIADEDIVVNDDFQSEAHALTAFDAHHPDDRPTAITIGRQDTAFDDHAFDERRVDTSGANPFQIFTASATATPIEPIDAPSAAAPETFDAVIFDPETFDEAGSDVDFEAESALAPIQESLPEEAQPVVHHADDRRETNRLFDRFVGTAPVATPPAAQSADAATQPNNGFALLPGADDDADHFVVPPFTLPTEELVDQQAPEAASPFEARPAAETSVASVQSDVATPVSAASAATRIASRDLEDLSPVELLERLAMAMDEQRKVQAEAHKRAAEADVARLLPVQPLTEPSAQTSTLPISQPIVHIVPPVTPPVAVVTPIEPASPEPAPAEGSFQVTVQRTEPAPVRDFARPGFVSFPSSTSAWHAEEEASSQTAPTVPEWHAAETAATSHHDDAETPVFAGDTPMPISRIPTALRPVTLDPIESTGQDDDVAPLASFPPLHSVPASWPESPSFTGHGITENMIAEDMAPAPFLATGPASLPHATIAPEMPIADPETDEHDTVLEDGYSSLLNLSRPARAPRAFIRIEDSEADNAEAALGPLPAVVFPGQELRAAEGSRDIQQDPFGAAPASPYQASAPQAYDSAEATGIPASAGPSSQASGARPFDAPTSFGSSGFTDPEETERALRTALATLQRMSGTA